MRFDVGAVAFASAFATGCVLVQAVVIPGWRAMAPEAYLEEFRRSGPRLGTVLFPVELAATALLGVVARQAKRQGQRGAAEWYAATACEFGTVMLFGVYFGRANLALLSETFPVEQVAIERERWRRWNGVRAALAVSAAVLAARGATRALGRNAVSGAWQRVDESGS